MPTRSPYWLGKTVLVVDDEGGIRSLVRSILSKHGFVVIEARDGEQALSLLMQEPLAHCIDLLVTDIQMPGANGVSVAHAFMRMFPNARVILMSGYSEVDSIKPESPEKWCFVAKPFLPQTLVLAVERIGIKPDSA